MASRNGGITDDGRPDDITRRLGEVNRRRPSYARPSQSPDAEPGHQASYTTWPELSEAEQIKLGKQAIEAVKELSASILKLIHAIELTASEANQGVGPRIAGAMLAAQATVNEARTLMNMR